MGILLTYIDCEFTTLSCAAHANAPEFLKQKWADQVTGTLALLHQAGIVLGDAKPDNVLIAQSGNEVMDNEGFAELNGDAWIIDFDGGYTEGYVEKEKAGTVEGNLQGLANIIKYIFRDENSV
jgi:serine/threonine protein kinase